MKLIVDTNIVFSGILNQKSRIGKILISHRKYFDFYNCNYLKDELQNNFSKLKQITGKSVEELEEIGKLITANIRFINEVLLPGYIVREAEELAKDIITTEELLELINKFETEDE